MTGNEIRSIREDLRLNPHALADILGVSLATVYRWESLKGADVRVEPLQQRILTALHIHLNPLDVREKEILAESVKLALRADDGLSALAFLLLVVSANNPMKDTAVLASLVFACDSDLTRHTSDAPSPVGRHHAQSE